MDKLDALLILLVDRSAGLDTFASRRLDDATRMPSNIMIEIVGGSWSFLGEEGWPIVK